MSEFYKIRLEDEVTGNAYRIAKAYVDVSAAAQRMSAAVNTGDKVLIRASRGTLQFYRTHLMAAKAAKTAGDAIGKLGPKFQSVVPPAAKATAGVFKFNYALNALAQSGMNLVFSMVGKFASGLVDAGKGLFDVADLATRAHLSFANFFGGQMQGDKTLNDSIEIAARYGFTIEDTIKQMQRFGAAGFSAENSKGLLRFGADMMAAGRSVQDVKGIFLAMTQIQGKGKLQAEELTQQLAERGINAGRVWDILAQKLGVTRDEVLKLQKAGKIGSGMALNAIIQAGVEGVRGTEIGQAGKKVADQTVGGLGRRMGTLLEKNIFEAVDSATPQMTRAMQSLFGGLTGSDLSSFKDGLTSTLKSVSMFVIEVGHKMPAIADAFVRAFGAASGVGVGNLNSFVDSLPRLAGNLGTIAGHLANLAAIIARIATNPLVTRVLGVSSAVGSAIADPLSVPGKVLGSQWENTKGMALNAFEGLFGTAEKLGADVGGAATDGMAFGIDKGAPAVGQSMYNAAQGAIDVSSDTIEENSPSRVFHKQGEHIARGLALGVDEHADLAMHSTRMMADGAIASAAGAQGRNPRAAISAGAAAGAAVSSRSTGARLSIGDILLSGGGGAGGMDQAETIREYIENEVLAFFERQAEGSGA